MTIPHQIWILEEMLQTMESLTVAGQRHNMEKVLACLRRIGGRAASLSPRNNQTVVLLLEQLSDQIRLAMPDVGEFAVRARAVAALLSPA